MKTLTFALALASLFTGQAFACSMPQNYHLRLKNDLIAELVNDYRVNASIDNLISLEVNNLTGGAFYTFPDRGADCPDSVRISGEIDTTFRREIRYNREKSETIYERVSKNEISHEEAAELLRAIETCSIRVQVVSTKIPHKRGAPSYYRTEFQEIEALSCAE